MNQIQWQNTSRRSKRFTFPGVEKARWSRTVGVTPSPRIRSAARTISVWRGVPTIENVAYTAPYQYDGRAPTLEVQANGALQAHSQIDHQPSSEVVERIKATRARAEVERARVVEIAEGCQRGAVGQLEHACRGH